jgi:flavin-dependent dehydrogenase
MPPAERFDVLVIGGGPAGSTVSTLLARRGHRVLVLEKDRHPRFHIGESLLPCNLPILEELGVLDEVRAIGVEKLGADFSLADDDRHTTYHFARAFHSTPGYAYEVKRSEFDELLFRNAQKSGVDAREGMRVVELEQLDGARGGPKRTRAVAVDEAGEKHAFEARYLVDASGRDTFLSKKLGIKRKNKQHASAAIFGHFEGVTRRDGRDAGNISIYWFDHGWMWFIPLREGVTSVGAVCWPEYLKSREGSLEDFLWATIRKAPRAIERMKDAKLVSEVRATGNYSYTSDRMTGPGWLMVGDAFAFIDPVFSSGVFLAMNGARRAAEVVDEVLREPGREAALQRGYDAFVRKGLVTFSWFIQRFTSPGLRWIFKHPRNVYRIEEAVISMLAGDVFRDTPVRSRFRALRAIYAVRTLVELPDAIRNLALRRRNAKQVATGITTPEGQPDTVGFS